MKQLEISWLNSIFQEDDSLEKFGSLSSQSFRATWTKEDKNNAWKTVRVRQEFGAICGQTVKDWKMEGTLYSLFLTVVFTSHVLHDSRVENPLLPTIFEIQKYYFHFDLEFFTCTTIYNFAHLTWYSSLPEIHDGGNESLINVELWRKKKEIERS